MVQRTVIEDLFIAAAELPREERSAWLDNACNGDAALRCQIDSLLTYDEGDSRLLSRVVQHGAVLLMEGDAIPGLRIGPWRVTESLGRGGMGAVYLAVRDDDQFTKQVAIKFIRRGMDTPGVVERFIRERQILASLDHPYIAKLLDGGTTADGIPYIVMEYVPGIPVDIWCNEHKPGVEERCQMFRKICEAVSYAHRNLVVHRDLKPTNILVTPEGTPMLLDFGIAKLIEDAASSAQTATANWALTPDYASPEQIRGHATTTSTDVYSLGIIFYQLLTGTRPYSIDSTSPLQVERTVCEQHPPRPSSVKRDRKLAGDLDNIVLMALRKEPERRYSSVEQFSEDVRRYLCALPVIARDDTFRYRAQKFLNRNRAAALAAAFTCASLIAAAGISLVEARRADQARIVAETQGRNAVRERDRAEREHAAADQQRDAARKASGDATLRAKEAETQRRRAEARVADLVELGNRSLLDVQATLARVPGALEARKAVVESTLRYLDNLQQTSANDPDVMAVLVSGYTSIGDVLGLPLRANLGDQKGAVAAYAKAKKLAARLAKMHPLDPRQRLQTIGLHQRIGIVLESEGNVTQAVAEYRAGLLVAEKLARDFPTVAHAVLQVGIMERQLARTFTSRDINEAEMHARREIAVYERANAMDPEEAGDGLTTAHGSLARILVTRERPGEAVAEYRVSLKRAEEKLALHPNDAIAQGAVASVSIALGIATGAMWQPSLGDPAGARIYTDRALAIFESLAAADKTNRKATADLGEALGVAGAMEGSLTRLQRSVTMLQQLTEANPRQVPTRAALSFAREYLGRAKFASGDTAGAIEEYRRSIEASRSVSELSPTDVTSRVQTMATQHALSEALLASGEQAKALDLAREAAAVARTTDVVLPVRTRPLTLSWVGDTFRDARDVASACSVWREAEPFEKDPRRLETLQAKLAACR